MSKCTAFEQDWLDHYFLNSDIANVGDATGLRGSTATTWGLFVELLGAWPGETGTVSGNLAVYTSYAQVEVARAAGGWNRSGSTMRNTAEIAFPQCGATGDTVIGWGIRRATASSVFDYIGVLAQAASKPFVVENGQAANTVICPSHGVVVSDSVRFIDVEGATLPTQLSDGELDTVATQPDTDTFTLTTNSTLGDGSGRFAEVLDKVVTEDDTPKIAISALQVTED